MIFYRAKTLIALLLAVKMLGGESMFTTAGVEEPAPNQKGASKPPEKSVDKLKAKSESSDRPTEQGPALPAGALARLEGHWHGVFRLAFAPTGQILVTGGLDGIIGFWETATWKNIRMAEDNGSVWALAFSPDGKRLASGDVHYRMIRVWDSSTGKERLAIKGHKEAITGVVFSPDGKTLISASVDKTICHWNAATGQQLHKLEDEEIRSSLALSPNGKILAGGGDEGTIRLWEVASWRELRYLRGHKGEVRSLTFSPNGELLASAGGISDCTIRFWDVASGKEKLRLRAHEAQDDLERNGEVGEPRKGVQSVTFSPDGKVLASSGGDGVIRLWEVATGKELGELEGHTRPVYCVAFSPDGSKLASGSSDDTVLIWDISRRIKDGRLRAVQLTPKELEETWAGLGSPEVGRIKKALWADDERWVDSPELVRTKKAIWTFRAASQTVAFFKDRLPPIKPIEGAVVAQFINELDNDRFAIRKKATEELAKLAELAEPGLRAALSRPETLEKQRRITQLLERLEQAQKSPERLRVVRAIQVLEYIDSPEAKQLLETLSGGAEGAKLTQEAKAALKRMQTSQRLNRD